MPNAVVRTRPSREPRRTIAVGSNGAAGFVMRRPRNDLAALAGRRPPLGKRLRDARAGIAVPRESRIVLRAGVLNLR